MTFPEKLRESNPFASSFSAKNCGCFRRLMKALHELKGTAAGGCLSSGDECAAEGEGKSCSRANKTWFDGAEVGSLKLWELVEDSSVVVQQVL